jgi:glycerol-3-phosphate dehydrogenase
MRESIRERSALLRVAPGLVEPLPVLVPTGPPGVPGKAAYGAALAHTHLLSLNRNRGVDAARRIAAGRILSRAECLRLCPALDRDDISGGALWYDARMARPERLTLAFVASAAAAGAQVANYAEAESFEVLGDAVRSVGVVDRLTGRREQVRARRIVIAAGPWTAALASKAGGPADAPGRAPRYALAMNLVIGRRLASAAVGLKAAPSSEPDPGGSGGRFLFLAPQERSTLLGTWYGLADQRDDPGPALDRGAEALLGAFTRACPGLDLSERDVVGRQWGRLPLEAGLEPGSQATLAERPRLGRPPPGGPVNLLTVEAVKYTTARGVAQNVVDVVLASMGLRPRACRTDRTPLVGAEISPSGPSLEQRIRHAVRDEMAMTLSDVVYRRTELGDPPGPDRDALRAAARIAGDELAWDDQRRLAEESSVAFAGAM